MANSGKGSDKSTVADWFQKLDHPLLEVIQALRKIILSADKEIGEQIKWNSPSFYYTGDMKPFNPKEYKRDIVVFNLHKKDSVLLVFPTGAVINDDTGLLQGSFTDSRKTTLFKTLTEVADKSAITNGIKKMDLFGRQIIQ